MLEWGLYWGGGVDWTPLLFAAIGVFMLWGGISKILFSRKFGKPRAWISELTTRPGDTIHFFYEQQCHQNTDVKFMNVSLVFRERVDFYEVSETVTKEVDRLIGQFEYAGRGYSAGEMIRRECLFRIPDRDMGIRNLYMNQKDAKVETLWVVKVRMNLGKARDFWREYGVEVTGEPRHYTPEEISREAKMDVILVEHPPMFSFRHWKLADSVFSHLDVGQTQNLMVVGQPLLERLTSEHAESVREQLEEAKVQVEIRPSV